MNIVFCADRRVLAGLHVAMYSLLAHIGTSALETRFFLFCDDLVKADSELLRQTLSTAGRKFTLEVCRIDRNLFVSFPPLNGSHATYYRLMAAQFLPVERFLYVDADTLCDVDVSELNDFDFGGAPAALVAEAPLACAMDRFVAGQLGNSETEPYFNCGVILVNVPEWRRQSVTERAMEYIAAYRPPFHDQSAVNAILYGNLARLPDKFNCIANMRNNWPTLLATEGNAGKLVHFLDYPKPWDFMGEFVHPQYGLWRSALDKTAMKGFRSWQATPARKFPKTRKAWTGYQKAVKDRLLFAGYSTGLLKSVKGVNTQ